MGCDLEDRKKLLKVWLMNSVGLINMTIVNSVGIFDESVAMNSNFKERFCDEQCILVNVLGKSKTCAY